MKRSSWVGLIAASSLLLAACSSGGTPAASTSAVSTTAVSTTAAATSTASSAASSATSSRSSSSSEAESSTEAPAAELDAATETWFTTFCSSLAEIGQYTSPDTAGQSLDQQQATVVTAYTGISDSANKAAAAIQATPPPTITSGDEIASATAQGFQDLADVYGKGAQTVAALTPSSENDLKTAVESVEDEARSAAPQSLADLDPGVETAVKQLPACAEIVG